MWKSARMGWRTCVLGCVLALGVAAPVRADPVTISGSFALATLEGPVFNFIGPTFTVSGDNGRFNDGFGIAPDFSTFCGRALTVQCMPGDSLQLSGTTRGEVSLGPGTVTVGGTTFRDAQVFIDAVLEADSVTVPEEQSIVQLMSRFSFTGRLRASADGQDVLLQNVVGQGNAIGRLFLDEPGRGFFDENNSIGYVFDAAVSPTPEPGSLLLLGSGIAGLVARQRRAKPA